MLDLSRGKESFTAGNGFAPMHSGILCAIAVHQCVQQRSGIKLKKSRCGRRPKAPAYFASKSKKKISQIKKEEKHRKNCYLVQKIHQYFFHWGDCIIIVSEGPFLCIYNFIPFTLIRPFKLDWISSWLLYGRANSQ